MAITIVAAEPNTRAEVVRITHLPGKGRGVGRKGTVRILKSAHVQRQTLRNRWPRHSFGWAACILPWGAAGVKQNSMQLSVELDAGGSERVPALLQMPEASGPV